MHAVAITTTAVMMLASLVPACSEGTAAQQKDAKVSTAGADLDRLLAPVALYPDQLLAQILLCASEPQKVTELSKWLASNKALKGTELQDAATVDGFDPSFVALALFPQVVDFLAQRLDWTTRLGKAFVADKTAVFDSIQRLRQKAQEAGSLKSTPQQDVETRTTSGGEQVIVIEPANPQVIYVPQYDPQVVYVPQPTTTTVVVQDDDDADEAVAGLIGFTAGIALGAAIDNDYYYGPYGWRGGAYMYNDAWDDWYDAREDAREDWIDHREDLVEERGERAGEARGERTERVESRQDTRGETQAQRTERQQTRQETASQAGSTGSSGYGARGHSGSADAAERRGTASDAFSGYSSGKSERAASSRGQRSRSGARASGGGGRRR